MSKMKELFMKKEEIIERELIEYYVDKELLKDMNAISHFESIINKIWKVIKIEIPNPQIALDFLNAKTYIENYQAITTLIENEQELEISIIRQYQGCLEYTQKEYFEQIVNLLKLTNRVDYIERTIDNWKVEFKEFDRQDIEELVQYAMTERN